MAQDIENGAPKIDLRSAVIGSEETVSISDTFVQYGIKNDKYILRFATAVSGSIKNLTYKRVATDKEDNIKEVNYVYEGITAGDDIMYYNPEAHEVTTDETYKGKYYWACYTIEFEDSTNYDLEITVSAKAEDYEGNIIESTPRVTTLNSLISENAKDYSITSKVVEDTYIASNSTSAKTTDNSKKDTLGTYSQYYRVYFKFNFKDILSNPDYALYKDSGKISFNFSIVKGSDKITSETKFTFKGYIPQEGVTDVDFSKVWWNNVLDTGDYPNLHWNKSEYLLESQVQGDMISCVDDLLTFTFDCNQIEKYIDSESGNAVFVLMIPGTSGISLASMENTTFEAPSVSFTYRK